MRLGSDTVNIALFASQGEGKSLKRLVWKKRRIGRGKENEEASSNQHQIYWKPLTRQTDIHSVFPSPPPTHPHHQSVNCDLSLCVLWGRGEKKKRESQELHLLLGLNSYSQQQLHLKKRTRPSNRIEKKDINKKRRKTAPLPSAPLSFNINAQAFSSSRHLESEIESKYEKGKIRNIYNSQLLREKWSALKAAIERRRDKKWTRHEATACVITTLSFFLSLCERRRSLCWRT